jgi:hypothetical protein
MFRLFVIFHCGYQADDRNYEEKYQQTNHYYAEIVNDTESKKCDKSRDTNEGRKTC